MGRRARIERRAQRRELVARNRAAGRRTEARLKPDATGWVEPDSATFLTAGAHVQSIVSLAIGEEPEGRVLIDLEGKWNHGARDGLSLVASPELAEELGALLLESARAARRDVQAYLAGRRPDDHERPR